MLWASDDMSHRPDYIYRRAPGGGYVGYHQDARPSINWKHIDGPLLYYRDGQMHWLTPWERFRCWLGRDDAESIERKRRPELVSVGFREIKSSFGDFLARNPFNINNCRNRRQNSRELAAEIARDFSPAHGAQTEAESGLRRGRGIVRVVSPANWARRLMSPGITKAFMVAPQPPSSRRPRSG